MSIKRKISFEARIALLAVFTSIGALCISAYQAYMQRLQTYAAAMPALTIYTSANYNSSNIAGNTFELILENKGAGPAKIDSVLFKFGNEKYGYFQDIVTKITNSNSFGTNELWKNRMISANERITLITLVDSNAKIIIEKFLQTKTPAQFDVEIKYSSIYDEKWKLNFTNLAFLQTNVKL